MSSSLGYSFIDQKKNSLENVYKFNISVIYLNINLIYFLSRAMKLHGFSFINVKRKFVQSKPSIDII